MNTETYEEIFNVCPSNSIVKLDALKDVEVSNGLMQEREGKGLRGRELAFKPVIGNI